MFAATAGPWGFTGKAWMVYHIPTVQIARKRIFMNMWMKKMIDYTEIKYMSLESYKIENRRLREKLLFFKKEVIEIYRRRDDKIRALEKELKEKNEELDKLKEGRDGRY